METRKTRLLKESLGEGKGFHGHRGRPGMVGGSTPRATMAMTLPEPYPAPETVKQAARRLANAGYKTWLVGGSVRDYMAGKTPHDFDMATDATPDETKQVFGRAVKPDVGGEAHGTVRVQESGDIFEITTLRLDVATDGRRATVAFTRDVLQDLQRRDLDFNALALTYNPDSDEFTELIGPGERGSPREALLSLKNKSIKFVGDGLERIREDRLRALRAVRFAVKMGATLSEQATKDIKAAINQGLIKLAPFDGDARDPNAVYLSGERVRDELLKTLAHPNGVDGIRMWKKLGLLDEFFPEFVGAEGQIQNRHHGDITVQEHILNTMDKAKLPMGSLDVFGDLAKHLDISKEQAALALLRFTMLMHDIAKMKTVAPHPKNPGEFSFHGHEDVGAEIADHYARRLRLDGTLMRLVVSGTAEHMAVPDPGKTDDAAIRRWGRKLREKNPGLSASGIDPVDWLLAIRRADWGAKPNIDETQDFTGEVKIRQVLASAPAQPNNKPPISGTKIMEWTGLKPGREIGQITRRVAEYLDATPDATEEQIKHLVLSVAGELKKSSLGAQVREAIYNGDLYA